MKGRPAFERRTIFAKSRATDSQSNQSFLSAGPEQHQGAGAEDDGGGSYGCMAARTALILPFTWEDDTVSAVNWTEKLLKRCIRDKQTGRRVPLWELNQSLPLETAELSAHFRQIVGWNEEVRRAVHVEALHARRRLDLPEASPAAAPGQPSAAAGGGQQQSKEMEEDEEVGMEDEEDNLDGGEGGELEDSSGDEDEAEDEAAHRRKMEVWKCSRLRLTQSALALVFPEPALWAADMQGQSNTVAFDNSSHLAFLTSTTNLLQPQPQPHGLHPRQPGGLATPGLSGAAAAAAAAAGSALRVPRSRSTPYVGRPEQMNLSSSDGGGAADGEDDKELEEEKDDSDGDDGNDAVVATPSKRKPDKSRMPLRRSESQRPVTPVVRIPSLMSTMPDSPFTPSGPSTVSALDAKTTSLRIGVPCVELVLYPMGGGLLVFHIDWMPNARNKKLSVDELRRWLFLVKFRHRVKKVFLGWTLGPSDHAKLLTPRSKKNERNSAPILGKLAGAIKGEELISLATIGNWLLHLPNESEQLPPHRVSHGTHANHHSTVVLDREPTEEFLQEYLFHLTRAFGQRNRPPPVKKAGSRLDQMLVHRQNRYIGISREGSVALSWPTDDSNVQFERVTWPKLFQGVYLILALHARGEAVVLSELSNLSASAAEHLRLDCTDNIEYLERHRAELRYLAMLMIKYSLGMSSDDCGGLPEYSNFFSTMRKMLGIPEARQEIRDEIQDVLGIVESGYMEEQRRQAASEKRASKLREFTQQVAETRRDEKTKRIERLISVIGAVTIPIVVVSGLPIEVVAPPAVAFWHLLVGVVLLSMLFAGALLYWQYAPSQDVDLPVPGLESDDQKAAQLRGDNMKASGVWDTAGPGVTPYRATRSGPDPSVLLTGLRSVRRGVSDEELLSVLRSHKPRKHVSYGAVDLEAPMTPFAPPAPCGRPSG